MEKSFYYLFIDQKGIFFFKNENQCMFNNFIRIENNKFILNTSDISFYFDTYVVYHIVEQLHKNKANMFYRIFGRIEH